MKKAKFLIPVLGLAALAIVACTNTYEAKEETVGSSNDFEVATITVDANSGGHFKTGVNPDTYGSTTTFKVRKGTVWNYAQTRAPKVKESSLAAVGDLVPLDGHTFLNYSLARTGEVIDPNFSFDGDETIYACWDHSTLGEHTITWANSDLDNPGEPGTTLATEIYYDNELPVYKGENPTAPDNAKASHEYQFCGFEDQETGKPVSDIVIEPIPEKNYTFIARFSDITKEYTVTFDYNYLPEGASESQKEYVTVKSGDPVGELSPAPVRPGYSDVPPVWYEVPNPQVGVDEPYEFSTPITADKTLYAQWTPNELTITLDPNGGEFTEGSWASIEVNYGQTWGDVDENDKPKFDIATHTGDLHKAGYYPVTDEGTTFVSWALNPDSQAPITSTTTFTQSVTLYAIYNKRTDIVINYDLNPVNDQHEYDSSYIRWHSGGTSKLPNPDNTMGAMPKALPASVLPIVIDPAISSSHDVAFIGWNTDKNATADDGGNLHEIVKEDFDSDEEITYYAVYKETIKKFTLSFDSCGGSQVNPISDIEYDTTVPTSKKPTDPTKFGYTFKGWFTDPETMEDEFIFGNSTTGTHVKSDMTVYAKWEKNKYDVNFRLYDPDAEIERGTPAWSDDDTENVKTVEDVELGKIPALPEDVTAINKNPNWTFGGWLRESTGGIGVVPVEAVEGEVSETYTAIWEHHPDYKSVVFDVVGGTWSGPNSILVENEDYAYDPIVGKGEEIDPIPAPTKEGYKLADPEVHWYDSNDEAFNFATTKITDNITLHVKWTPRDNIRVNFNANGGSWEDATTKYTTGNTFGTLPILPEDDPNIGINPEREGYTFAGWLDSENKPVHDISVCTYSGGSYYGETYKAQWVQQTFTVTFESNGGTHVAPITNVVYGNTISEPQNVTKLGYTLEGWHTANTPTEANKWDFATDKVVRDLILYANWNIDNVTVTFNFGDAGGSEDISVRKGDLIAQSQIPSLPAYDGHTFAGWYTAETGGTLFDFSEAITAATTIYAHWTVDKFTVTFNSMGGSDVPAISNVNYGSTIATPTTAPTKAGYTFDHWCTDFDCQNEFIFSDDESARTATPVTTNTTLYAKWTDDMVSVQFVYHNGTSDAKTISIHRHDKILAGDIPTPTYAGHTFKGWYTLQEGGSLFNFNSEITANTTTIHAQWTIDTFTVTYNSMGGSEVGAHTGIEYGTKISAPTEPTKTGYTFDHWCTDYACTSEFVFADTSITTNYTLYAKWNVDNVTVTFNFGEAGGSENISVRKGDLIAQSQIPSLPAYDGHTFAGWYTASGTGGTLFDFSKAITAATTIYAHWTTDPVAHTITIGSMTGGSVTTNPTGSAIAETTITGTVNPNTGNSCTGVTVTDADSQSITVNYTPGEKFFTFVMPDKAVTINATFAADPTAHNITIASMTGGSVTTNPTGSAIAETTITGTVSPDANFHCTNVTVTDADSQSITVNYTPGEKFFTFVMPDKAVTINATFEADPVPAAQIAFTSIGTTVCSITDHSGTVHTSGSIFSLDLTTADNLVFIISDAGGAHPTTAETVTVAGLPDDASSTYDPADGTLTLIVATTPITSISIIVNYSA